MNVLNKIIRHKKNEISHLKLNYSTSQLESSLFFDRETTSLKSKLKSGEIKFPKTVNHSHIGSIGNLALDKIVLKMKDYY